MNSPSRALIWQILWKNRWGFVLLLIVLAACGGLRLSVAQRDLDLRQRRAAFPENSSGLVRVGDLFPAGVPPGESRLTTVRGEAEVLLQKPLRPQDEIAWSGTASLGINPMLQLRLNGLTVRSDRPLPPKLVISVEGGGKRTILFLGALIDSDTMNQLAANLDSWREAGLGWSVALFSFSVLVVFAIFGLAEPHATRGFTGFPPRHFTLPVPTFQLVCWPVVLGALTMFLLSLAWTGLVLSGLREPTEPLLHFYYALLLADGLVASQVLVWGLVAFPKLRAFLLTLSVFAMIVLAWAPAEPGASAILARSQPVWGAVFGVSWFVAAGLAWGAVTLDRRGQWTGWMRSSLLSRSFRLIRVQPVAFGSALEAQCWIEWRRNGRLPLLIWAAMVGVVVTAQLFAKGLFPSWTPAADALAGAGILGAMIWVSITGLNLARDASSRRLAMSTFTAVRPIPTGTLLLAKVLVGAALWFGAVAMLAGGGYLIMLASGGMDQIQDIFGLFTVISVLTAVSLNVFVGILPLCLFGRIAGFPWSLLPLLLVYGLLSNGVRWYSQHLWFAHVLVALLGACLLVKIAAALWAFWRSIRRQLSSRTFVAAYILFWLAGTALALRFAWWSLNMNQWPNDLTPLLFAAALIVPLARVAFSPLALSMNRHR